MHALSPIVRLDDASAELEDLVDACTWRSWLGLLRDGVLALPRRTPIERPDLAGNVDLLGFSYYFTIGARDGGIVPYPDGAGAGEPGDGIAPSRRPCPRGPRVAASRRSAWR